MRLPFISRQLPASSPLSGAALARSTAAMLRSARSAPRQLRQLICERFSADQAVLFDSGRSALQAAIRLAGTQVALHDRPTVALPAFQCFEVASAAVGSGVAISFYDVDPATLGPDLASLEMVLKAGAGIVVVAPLYGIPVDWDATSALVDRFGAFLIEDAAQGIGASWRDRRLGSLGLLSVLSFGRGKGWTGGTGGALCARGAAAGVLAAASPSQPPPAGWRVAAATWVQWMAGRPSIYGVPARLPWLHLGETRYHEPTAARAMPGFAAELLLRTADAAEKESESLRSRGRWWRQRLSGRSGTRPIVVSDVATAGYLRFPVLAATDAARRSLSGADARRYGVAPSYPLPLNRLSALGAPIGGSAASFPGAESLVRQLYTLPTHAFVTNSDCEAIDRLLV